MTESSSFVHLEPAVPDSPAARRLLGHPLHTLLLILILLGASFGGSQKQQRLAHSAHGREILYGTTILYEWVLVGYIYYFGLRKRGVALREVIGGRWEHPEDVLLDIAVAFVFWVTALFVVAATKFELGMVHFDSAANINEAKETAKVLQFLVPESGVQVALFTLLTVTAGFCEEVIFRGYFQKQFSALTGSIAIGIAAQAVLFGAAHGYQGVRLMIVLAVFGACFGNLAHLRGSLRSGMMAHAWQDFFSGMALKFLGRFLK